MPFAARHTVDPVAAGFEWIARVRAAPLASLTVRDTLKDGKGGGEVRLWSALRLAYAANTPEMNSGALHRYLAEAPWYPTALLPSSSLAWRSIDHSRALATLTSHGVTVSLEFGFNAADEVTRIYGQRWGRFGRTYKQVPWEGHFSDYEERDGFIIPLKGQVGWYENASWECVWRGEIRHATYAYLPGTTNGGSDSM